MSPHYSALLAALFLLSGAVAVITMLNRLGRPESQPTTRQLVLHRVSGWLFTASFLVLFATMFSRFYSYWDEDPARIVFHYTAAFALLMLLIFKLAIARFYPGFRKHLFILGSSVFLLAFLTGSATLSYYLVRVTQKVPYISRARLSSTPDLVLGKQLAIDRCSVCHLLDAIMLPRGVGEWESVVERMSMIAWPRISRDEAKQILFYLSVAWVPSAVHESAGFSKLEAHCLPCHNSTEIFGKQRSLKEWDEVVRKMTEIAPDVVPALQHDIIVDHLMETQSKAASKK